MLTERQLAQRRAAAAAGGRARARQFTSESQRAARAELPREVLQRGARTTIERYGFARFHAAWRAWKIDHPTRHELRVACALAALGMPFEREFSPAEDLPFTTVDFWLPGPALAIEVYGEPHDGGEMFDPGGDVAERDAERLETLRAAGVRVLVLHWRDLDQAAARIQEVLEPEAPRAVR